jgi:hypothetical protein
VTLATTLVEQFSTSSRSLSDDGGRRTATLRVGLLEFERAHQVADAGCQAANNIVTEWAAARTGVGVN